jgi:hypothetical protein
MAPQFRGNELNASDFVGGCCFLEITGGVAWGYAVYAMGFGMTFASIIAGATSSMAMGHAIGSSNGYILFRGMNYGLQGGFGAGSFFGLMRG